MVPYFALQIYKRSILNTLIHFNQEVENWSPLIVPQTPIHYPKYLVDQITQIWQHRLDVCHTGAWTKHLISQVGTQSPISFWTTQALSCHGLFGSYLHMFHKRPTPKCALYQTAIDTLSFALTECTGYILQPKHWQD